MMSDLFLAMGPWVWIVLGVVLVGLELLAPGVFLIWLGLAAIATGLLDWALDLSWQTAFLVFAALSVVAVLIGRALGRSIAQDDAGADILNRRGHGLIGRTFLLEAPIKNGEGRIRVDDSSWRITGPDLEKGVTIRVLRVEGTTLVVERVSTDT